MKTAITINDQPVYVPASWSEVTFGQFLAMKEATTDAELMAVFTGFPLAVCEQISPDKLAIILQPSTMMGEPEFSDVVQIFGKDVPGAIGQLEYARKVNCDAVQRDNDSEQYIGRMVAIYCAEGIEDEDIEAAYTEVLTLPFTSVISAGRIISNQLVEMQKGEETIKAPEYESEEFSAGIGDFKKYGVFGLVRGIALRHHCTKEDVFRWSYNSVILELRYSADENAYQRRLNNILSRKK